MVMMKPRDILDEIAFPLSEMAVLLAIITFWLFAKLAVAAGLLGLWLAIVVVPAFFRYLLYVLEARASARPAPTLGIELFNWVENFWSLFPLVLLATIVWGEYFLANNYSALIAGGFGLLVAAIFPASMAVLAITRSPIESLRPVALLQLIRVCRADYWLLLLTIGLAGAVLVGLVAGELPGFIVELGFIYVVFLLFTFTGGVVARSGASAMLSIPDVVDLTTHELGARVEGERSSTLNHAYAFISRDNRAGGLAHIQAHIDNSADPSIEYPWFFNAMLSWESKDAALFFAQRYLSYLLDTNEDVVAMKLITRCRLENSLFKPLHKDRERALDIAKQLDHDDMIRFLTSIN
jgi:hypothetical protein